MLCRFTPTLEPILSTTRNNQKWRQEKGPRNEVRGKVQGEKRIIVLLAPPLMRAKQENTRRKLKYHDELLKAQEEAKKSKRGVWK